jgi:hypothetical protein
MVETNGYPVSGKLLDLPDSGDVVDDLLANEEGLDMKELLISPTDEVEMVDLSAYDSVVSQSNRQRINSDAM